AKFSLSANAATPVAGGVLSVLMRLARLKSSVNLSEPASLPVSIAARLAATRVSAAQMEIELLMICLSRRSTTASADADNETLAPGISDLLMSGRYRSK